MKTISTIFGYLSPIIFLIILMWGSYSMLPIGKFIEDEVYHKCIKVKFDDWYYGRKDVSEY